MFVLVVDPDWGRKSNVISMNEHWSNLHEKIFDFRQIGKNSIIIPLFVRISNRWIDHLKSNETLLTQIDSDFDWFSSVRFDMRMRREKKSRCRSSSVHWYCQKKDVAVYLIFKVFHRSFSWSLESWIKTFNLSLSSVYFTFDHLCNQKCQQNTYELRWYYFSIFSRRKRREREIVFTSVFIE